MNEKQITEIFPEKMDILPCVGLVRKIGEVIRFVIFFPIETENTGAAPLLDRELYENGNQQTLF